MKAMWGNGFNVHNRAHQREVHANVFVDLLAVTEKSTEVAITVCLGDTTPQMVGWWDFHQNGKVESGSTLAMQGENKNQARFSINWPKSDIETFRWWIMGPVDFHDMRS